MTTPQAAEEAAGISATSPTLSGGPTGEGGGITVADPSSPWTTIPQIGAYRTEDHRYYWNGQGELPSVTTVLEILHKPALMEWVGRVTAEEAYILKDLPGAEDLTLDEWSRHLRERRFQVRDKAAEVGTGVHLYADMAPRASESDSAAFNIPDGWIPYVEAFRRFLDRFSASNILSSEKSVFSLGDGYGGTYDFLMMIDGELWLIDIKTSKGVYPETGLQLAAYSHAEFIGLPNDPRPYPMPKVQRTGVLHLRPDAYPDTGWRLIEYPTTGRDYVAFLGALEVFRWKKEGRFTKQKLKAL